MKPFHIFLIVLGAFVFLMLGCFLFFGVSIGLITIQDVIKDMERLYRARILAGIVGIFFLSVGYVAIKLLIKRSYRDEIFVFDSEYGRTSISIMAVDDLIKRTLRKYENIKKHYVKIAIQNKVLMVQILLKLWMGRPAADVIEDIQSEVRKKLGNYVGLKPENFEVTVKVTKVFESRVKESS